jgi:hypothetical protein
VAKEGGLPRAGPLRCERAIRSIVCGFAKRPKEAAQALRLLSITAVLEGAARENATYSRGKRTTIATLRQPCTADDELSPRRSERSFARCFGSRLARERPDAHRLVVDARQFRTKLRQVLCSLRGHA